MIGGLQITGPDVQFHGLHLSAFPHAKRPFTEVGPNGEDKVIGSGLTLPAYGKLIYPQAIFTEFSQPFGFMTRDNKERKYVPELADRFVFNSMRSLDEFTRHAHGLLAHLLDRWKSFGLPTKFDKDRKIEAPDDDALWDKLSVDETLRSKVEKHIEEVSFIASNFDIMKKACVVRAVTYGWWASSYSGRDSKEAARFAPALRVLRRAIKAMAGTKRFKTLVHKLWDEAGDPIDTNPGYPFFKADMSPDGVPLTRLRTIGLLADIYPNSKHLRGAARWQHILKDVDNRCGQFGLPGHPFAIANIRRLQPNNKWNHQFRITSQGMVTAYDERGFNTQRIAFMVPYAYNVLLTPFHCNLKAFRMMMPGMYHDGESRKRRLAELARSTKAGLCFMAEADYSNYDRYMPVDIVREVMQMVCDLTPDPEYYMKASMYLHDDASLIWPDFNTQNEARGWVFKPGKLGLLSGVKLTSETGSFVNYVVNLQSLMDAEGWTEDQAYNYTTMYCDESIPIGSRPERFYIQSDDSLLIASSLKALLKQGDSFKKLVAHAGLKGSVIIGDRFLMRHMIGGKDLPVPARVWQNTLSNETPPEDHLIFNVGVAGRTDGLHGVKSVDPFATGDLVALPEVIHSFTDAVMDSLIHFTTTAKDKSEHGIRLLRLLRDAPWKNAAARKELHALRRKVTGELASAELARMAKLNAAMSQSYLYSLYKDRYQPSSALLLHEFELMSGEVKTLEAKFEQKEHSFFTYASERMGVKLFECTA